MNATKEGHLDVVRCLLEAKADLEANDNDGCTALNVAARNVQNECGPALNTTIARFL